jgi:hypothetical protein
MLSIFTLTAFSCNKIKDALTVDVDMTQTEVAVTIPIVAEAGKIVSEEGVLRFDVDSFLKATNNKASADNIRSVKLVSCTVQLLDNTVFPDDNLTAFSGLQAEFSTDIKNTWTTLALLDDTVVDPYLANANVKGNTELKDYFRATQFRYRITGNAKRATGHPIECRLTLKYKLSVGLK